MRKKYISYLFCFILTVILVINLVACSTNFKNSGDGTVVPNVDTPVEHVETDSQSTEINKKTGVDSDGNLLAPFDIVYPEQFNSGNHQYSKDHLLIKMHKDFNGVLNDDLKNAGLLNINLLMNTKDGNWYKVGINSGKDIQNVVRELRSKKLCLIVDYDYEYQTEAVENPVEKEQSGTNSQTPTIMGEVSQNAQLGTQWYLNQCGIPQAWQYLKDKGISPGGDSSIVVAVIDTGVDYNHPDLKANMWVNTAELNGTPGVDDDNNGYVDDIYGLNAVANNGYADMENVGNPMDDHGHGTHVAGIIAASNNKEGIVGIAYNARIMAVKAGQASGVFNQSDIAEAILYAYQNGADVINMSFGGSACSIAVQDALKQAYTTCSLVASAGNNGAHNELRPYALPNYPADLSYVIGVMSVDNYGVESVFTNYDVKAYTKHEYEVYAPGENIMSTLPNGRYAKLSGTSMSAPVVSGLAALLRSYFKDRDKYPSKYIMAQLAATSEDVASCCNPAMHNIHNLPMIVNGYSALTKLPKPDVNLIDYKIFDSKNISNANNEDGVVDAGETINIGAVLKNRWGMSKDTVVSISANSDLGVENPYVEIINGNTDFGGVGTYSTKDLFIRNGQNIITGVEQPLAVKIKDNCPNDYLIKLSVEVTFLNGLDDKDSFNYSTKSNISFTVRNGVILPSQITESMTLTANNYYIIPNSTYIAPGVTVIAEAGTKIQFWTDDPHDPYANQYIASLTVAGKFITKGTSERPVEIFPSEMMSNYAVKINNFRGNNGIIVLNYANIVNPHVSINYADHCKISLNQSDNLRWKENLSDGTVQEWSKIHAMFNANECNNSVFYKQSESAIRGGRYNNCIFVDSSIDAQNVIFNNCVFEDNNHFNGCDGKESGSIINNYQGDISMTIADQCEYNKNTYFLLSGARLLDQGSNVAEFMGGQLLKLDTKEELDHLFGYFAVSSLYVSVRVDKNGDVLWHDGTPIGNFIKIKSVGNMSNICKKDGEYFLERGESAICIKIPNKSNEDGSSIGWTRKELTNKLDEWKQHSLNYGFIGNAVLNNYNEIDTNLWLRVLGPDISIENYFETNVNGNYWGTTDITMIEKQIIDFDDYNSKYKDIKVDNYLTVPPSNTFPFVVDAYLVDGDGNRTRKVSNGPVKFVVEFNRDMDTTIPLRVRFGSSEPYAEYEVKNGNYVNPRKWEGIYTLKTTIENGNQYLNIDNACAVDDAFYKLYATPGRFMFEVDTTAAQAMIMQGEATKEGINLTWTQDDFTTLAGYNVYRSDKEDGLYTRLNDYVLDPSTKTFFDSTVEPGKIYYYNFTVVQTDMTESKPSGKIVIRSLDTMAPGIHHSPVRVGYTGQNLSIPATITDNLMIKSADVYYRTIGTVDWNKAPMKAVNSRYMATIPAIDITLDGIEYYIDAYDGVNHTYNGTSENPHVVIIKTAISDNALGDVDGNGIIENKDALMLLQAANDLLNLTDEQFIRADINKDKVLSAAEALRILQYVSGKVTTIV